MVMIMVSGGSDGWGGRRREGTGEGRRGEVGVRAMR